MNIDEIKEITEAAISLEIDGYFQGVEKCLNNYARLSNDLTFEF